MTEERFTFQNKNKALLAGVLHLPKKKTTKCVVLCHGFTGTKEHWRSFGHAFEAAGIAAFRFDFTGSGESEGNFAKTGYAVEVADLESAIDLMGKKGFKAIGVMGHSFGGGVVVLASAMDKRIKAVIATAPTVFPKGEMLAKYAKNAANVTMDESFFEDVKEVDIISAAKKRAVPLFIITGTADDVVPCEESKELFEAAKEPKELKLIGGADHDFAGHGEELVETAVTWMKKHL